jgi:D-sedoheptulose 7-phosphate isomerase
MCNSFSSALGSAICGAIHTIYAFSNFTNRAVMRISKKELHIRSFYVFHCLEIVMQRIDTYLTELMAILAATPSEPLHAIARTLWETYERDGMIIVCGNGGSAATSSHFACDLAKWTICEGRRCVRALALTDNVALLSAWANDATYERVFVEQLSSHYRPGDTLVAISGSGNSSNVLRAVEWANARGATTIGLAGCGGGTLARLADLMLVVPSHCMPQIEDIHMAICHALAVNLGEMIKDVPLGVKGEENILRPGSG